MLSKSQVSFIKSLHQKKYRRQHGSFIVEGIKSVKDFLTSGYGIQSIFFTSTYTSGLQNTPANIKLFEVNNAELDKISTLQSPQGILAVVSMPPLAIPDATKLHGSFSLLLDGVQDPGNLGTIIRTADWFGIENIICSGDTAEAFNPKCVQASMGSLSRVNVTCTNLEEFVRSSKIPVFGASLEGENIFETNWGTEGLIVLGNEGNGISAGLMNMITHKITIPRNGHAESLNVAISAGIICSEIRRGGL